MNSIALLSLCGYLGIDTYNGKLLDTIYEEILEKIKEDRQKSQKIKDLFEKPVGREYTEIIQCPECQHWSYSTNVMAQMVEDEDRFLIPTDRLFLWCCHCKQTPEVEKNMIISFKEEK